MINIYADKEAFENIALFNEKYPNWFQIFCDHADVCLNISKKDYEIEKVSNPILQEFIKINSGREPIPLSSYFEGIANDNSIIAEQPRSVFFLNISKEEAAELQQSFGVIVQGSNDIDDTVLNNSFSKDLIKDEIIEETGKIGWKSLIKFDLPPSNALVIADSYLLPSIERVGQKYISSGKQNIIWLLDAILPPTLKVDYHITILSEDNDQSEAWRMQMAGNLKTEINNLRPYNINVEVVFIKSEHFHKRRLLMNYLNGFCDRGFYVFKVKDGKSVHVTNELRLNAFFSSLNNHSGDTEFEVSTKALHLIKTEGERLANHIRSGANIYQGAIMGDCKTSKSLKNRLINDV